MQFQTLSLLTRGSWKSSDPVVKAPTLLPVTIIGFFHFGVTARCIGWVRFFWLWNSHGDDMPVLNKFWVGVPNIAWPDPAPSSARASNRFEETEIVVFILSEKGQHLPSAYMSLVKCPFLSQVNYWSLSRVQYTALYWGWIWCNEMSMNDLTFLFSI